MIILISGATHTGKTMLAKRLSERYQIPCLNIESVKQNMIANDEYMAKSAHNEGNVFLESLWFVVENSVRECLEKGESMVLEGDYLAPQKVRILNDAGVLSMHLLFSPEYIEKNYDMIMGQERVKSNAPDVRSVPDMPHAPDEPGAPHAPGMRQENMSLNKMLEENRILKDSCANEVVPYFMFQEDYESEMDLVCELIDCMIV